MSVPMKPWEGLNLRNSPFNSPMIAPVGIPPNVYQALGSRGRLIASGNQQVPPLPPRTSNSFRSGGLSSLHHGPSLFNGGYGMYGGYGMPYGSAYGMRADYDSRFLQAAEEATNGTFQSIESLVRAFSSITMMLDSTYQALHMSFRSVLSVADNMSKLKSVAVTIFSSLPILKFLYWLYRRILYMLGLVNSVPLKESVWKAAESQVLGSSSTNQQAAVTAATAASTWPLIGLFGVMLGAPYLLYRAFAPQINSKTLEGWNPSTGIKVKAICDFDCPNRGEIPFKTGDILIVPSDFRVHHGWSVAKLGNSIGYIPADRVAPYNPIAVTQVKPAAASNKSAVVNDETSANENSASVQQIDNIVEENAFTLNK
ncbi:hypothetical protein O3M35_005852 [Rhynocoris fuscipes]|uniref:Peroxisomal membrane protein PEX13 n=1 Tax=Rhynocoris fuscipes TaxID=488301 RepID=A0AAW1DMG3_9HEMI